MKTDTTTSPEFERFDNLVGTVLSVPKADIEHIKSEPWSEEQKDRLLGYLKTDIEKEERRKSQVVLEHSS